MQIHILRIVSHILLYSIVTLYDHGNSFIHNMGLDERNSLPHLLDRISPEMENEASLIEHPKYYNDLDFRNVLHVLKMY